MRVALPIRTLMMLDNSVGPLAKPFAQRSNEFLTSFGVVLDDFVFLVGQATGFVQDLGGGTELANIVDQASPLKLRKLEFREAHLLADQL